jgi:hypothetical protein
VDPLDSEEVKRRLERLEELHQEGDQDQEDMGWGYSEDEKVEEVEQSGLGPGLGLRLENAPNTPTQHPQQRNDNATLKHRGGNRHNTTVSVCISMDLGTESGPGIGVGLGSVFQSLQL